MLDDDISGGGHAACVEAVIPSNTSAGTYQVDEAN